MRSEGRNPAGQWRSEPSERAHYNWIAVRTLLPLPLGILLLLGLAVLMGLLPHRYPGSPWAVRVVLFAAGGFIMIAVVELFTIRRALSDAAHGRHDIVDTLRKSLSYSQRRFDALMNQSAVGIAIAGMDGRILMANRKLCDLLGYSSDQLRYRSYQELTHPEDLPADEAQAKRLVAGEIESYTMEKRFIRADGTPVWTHLACSAVRGESDYVVAIIEDIAQRHTAEEALAESEQKFRSLTDHARAAIGMVQGTRIIYANPYLAELSGYSAEELVTMDLPDLVHPRSRGLVMEMARKRQSGEPAPNSYEFEMITRGGEARWIDFSAAAFEYRGQPAIIGTGFDITQRKQAEESLRISEARLAEAKDVAEAANRAKDQFLAVLSHELRTPLTPVLASASALQHETVTTEETQDSLAMICRNIELEARLIDDLLDLTRLSRGKLELRPQSVEICSTAIASRELELNLDCGTENWWVRADPPRLQQVFWNLLNNATKFTPPGGRIDVRVIDAPEGHVAVEITDTGVGIAPEVLPRIFAAFEQGSRRVTRKFGGLGLGLAISRAVVEMHGGMIEAHSEGLGKGATFRVTLPAIPAPQREAEEEPVGAVCDQEPEEPAKILLVEDHADTAKVMSRLLQVSGHTVRTADSVAGAIEIMDREDFDVLVSDLGLPDGSGLELMPRLRRERPGIKGIALSGYGMDEDIARSLAAGFSEHLIKPVSVDQLEAAIGRVLGKRRG